jgi:hypothetical protein
VAEGVVISVLCPTRGRPTLLRQSYESLLETAARPQDVEFLAAVDPDDFEVNVSSVSWLPDSAVRVMPERYGYDGLHVYYQRLAAIARGDWLLIWNDDAVMLTPSWDNIVEQQPPTVLVADIQSPHSPLCCFPAVRRTAVQALSKFSTNNPHVDTFWQDVGRATGTIVSVGVHANCKSAVKPEQTHGYYDVPHQAELAASAQKLREWLAVTAESC